MSKTMPMPTTMSDQEVRQTICLFLVAWEKQPQPLTPSFENFLHLGKKNLNSPQRTMATNLIAGVVRGRLRLDHFIARLSRTGGANQPGMQNLLRLALFELEAQEARPRPSFAIVSEAVNLCKIMAPGREGYVNAILRNFLRRGSAELLPENNDLAANLSLHYSLPLWLVEKWQKEFGLRPCRRLCRQANVFAGTTFRVNQLKISRAELLDRLVAAGPSGLRSGSCSAGAFSATQASALIDSPWFKEGFISVQDEGAQLIGELVNPKPGETILDACAAPGGKSAHLAELSRDQSHIFAADRDRKRLRLISENNLRLQLSSITPAALDLTQPLPAAWPQSYDAVLLDAPCSGLGVIRRRADLRWRKSPREIAELAIIQLQILENCSRYLRPGGRLIYATCTVSRPENQDNLKRFLARNPAFRLQSRDEIEPAHLRRLISRQGFLETSFLDEESMDGFFAARLIRTC
ncbi:MAG: 16S rRNA (cytosine(967)-C(5))-methyltransferase RsmB [Deltaproteobacteria bacterium]|nr:16S rRNA (cytosine(967)-C(5))-methyltransferase RsmB [Deltaproteobacteria bacterium]